MNLERAMGLRGRRRVRVMGDLGSLGIDPNGADGQAIAGALAAVNADPNLCTQGAASTFQFQDAVNTAAQNDSTGTVSAGIASVQAALGKTVTGVLARDGEWGPQCSGVAQILDPSSAPAPCASFGGGTTVVPPAGGLTPAQPAQPAQPATPASSSAGLGWKAWTAIGVGVLVIGGVAIAISAD